MRKWIIIGCALVSVIGVVTFFILSNQQKNQDDNAIMKIAIFPTGTSDESYYFTINEEGVLKCAVGSRKSDDIKKSDFLKITITSSEKKLTDANLQTLIDMANKLEIEGCAEKQVVTDSWEVAFLYNGNVYEIDYWQNKDSEKFLNLINKIIELSSIPVDLHEWA